MSIDDYRNNKVSIHTKRKIRLKKEITKFINKTLIVTIIVLIGLIITKRNPSLLTKIKKYVYEESIEFTKVKKAYNKYFGKYIGEIDDTKEVFSETISFKKKSLYKDGVKLEVSNNYLVPAIEGGIIVFIGEKEDYGNTIIVEQVNGINVWYGNVLVKDKKMYDYIKKGDLIGEVKSNQLYLLFEEKGKFLDYKKYI